MPESKICPSGSHVGDMTSYDVLINNPTQTGISDEDQQAAIDLCQQRCESRDDCGAYTTTDFNTKDSKRVECRLIHKDRLNECQNWNDKTMTEKFAWWREEKEEPRNQDAQDTKYHVKQTVCSEHEFYDPQTNACAHICKHDFYWPNVTDIVSDFRDRGERWRYGSCGSEYEGGCCRKNGLGVAWRTTNFEKIGNAGTGTNDKNQVFNARYLQLYDPHSLQPRPEN